MNFNARPSEKKNSEEKNVLWIIVGGKKERKDKAPVDGTPRDLWII